MRALLLALLFVASPAHALDVTHYRLEIDVPADEETLAGAATLDLNPNADDITAGAITLDFVGMEISTIQVDGLAEDGWSRADGALTIPLPATATTDDTLQARIEYAGAPEPYVEPWGTWGVVWSQDRVFTLNVIEGARHWFPCNDRLDDKATVELLVSVPEPWLVAAPGALLAQESVPDARTLFHWSADWPLPTYLIHFAAGPYVLTEEEHDGVPYQFYLHPTLYEDAADTFAHAAAATELWVARYGDYPFPKVAFDEIDLGGAVENPSCVSIGTQILVPAQVYEDVIAHEMSHSWFQGVVTCATWDDVWLSEGMATYHEALYHEHVHGPGTIADYTDSLAISYRAIAEMSEGYFPLSQPEVLWGVTTYRKGALVLHTLSHLMGRDIFDQFLNDYLDEFAWGNASTADFQATAEASSGLALASFFDEWVHGIGYPQFGLAWRYDSEDSTVEIAVNQAQPEDWPIFRSVPLELQIDDGQVQMQCETMDLTDRLTVASFQVPFQPATVTLDPDRWLLKTVEPMDFPDLPVEPEPDPEPDPEPTPETASEVITPPADTTNPATPRSKSGCATTKTPGSASGLLLLALAALALLRRPRQAF